MDGYARPVLKSLRARLLGSMVLMTSVVVGATLLVADPLVEERSRNDALTDLSEIAELAHAELARGADARELADRLAEANAAQVAIYGADDALLARTEAGRRRVGPEELARIRRVGRASEVRAGPHGRQWMYVWIAGDDQRVVRAARPLPRMSAARSTLRQVLLLAGLFAIAMAVVLSEYLTRVIGRPIREMHEAADAFRRGDLSTRVRSRRADELGALGSAIDHMADQLVERLRAVHEHEGRLRTILDAMVEGVFVTDAEGRIVLTNAALTSLAGGAVERRTAIEAIRSPELHEAVRKALEGDAAEVELELLIGAQRRSIKAQVAPLPTQGGVVAVLHDATELKHADAVRRDFVANASHELRTPLTSIRGFAETLLDGALADEKTARRFVGSIADNAKRLSSLVDDLLELSRAESPESRMELAPVEVGTVAREVLRSVEQRADAKKQELVLEGAGDRVIAKADARAIDQVLLNLVDNAIKYTPEGGRVTVRVRREGALVSIEVADNGRGIPRVHLDRIFERFYRVDKGRARAQGGTGLGLSIVRHLVTRMNGTIAVESRVGEGTVFRVSLAAGDA